MSEAVKNLLKEVGVDFKTEKSIEISDDKNEKIRLIEEKRRAQKRRNKKIKPKHTIFEDNSSKKATNKTTELLKEVGVDFVPQKTIEEKIEKFEEIIKENLHPHVEHIEEPVQLETFSEEEILPKKITAEPSKFPAAVVDAIDGMYEGKFYLDKPDLPDKDLIYPTVDRISDAIKDPLIEISPFRQELELFRQSITEQIGRAVSLGGGSGSGEVLLQRLDDVDDSNKGHGTTLAWSSVTQKYEAADPDLNAGISLEDDSGDEIIIDATASGGADEGGKILQEDNTRAGVTSVTNSSMSLSTSTLTLTDSADDTVTVDLSALVLDDDAITLAKMASGTDGNIISYDASGDPVAIATGSDGQVLTSAGAGAQPAFEDVNSLGTHTLSSSGKVLVFGF